MRNSPTPVFSACMHRHVTVITTGCRRFVSGEVFDDLEEHVQCLDCGEYLSLAEAYASMKGIQYQSGSINPKSPET